MNLLRQTFKLYPKRKTYFLAAIGGVVVEIGLGLGLGFYLTYNRDWASPASIAFVVLAFLVGDFIATMGYLMATTINICIVSVVLLPNGKSEFTTSDGYKIKRRIKYKKIDGDKIMFSPNKRTWFVFPGPEELKDYPLDQLIEITPESKEKKQ